MKNWISLFLLLVCSPGIGLSQPLPESSEFKLVRLADGVYACIHRIGGHAICNAGLIDNGESTIVFDDFLSPHAAEEMIRCARQLGLSPIRYVINSHAHNDHVRGNQAFGPEVKILSTRRNAELMASEEPASIREEAGYAPGRFRVLDSLTRLAASDTGSREYQSLQLMRGYFEELARSSQVVRTRLPDTFIEKAALLNGSKRSVQVVVMGKGHTDSDLTLFLPEEGILFTGDLVFHGFHPYLPDGDPEQWKKRLAGMELMKIRVLVPGHGEIGDKSAVTRMKQYIEDLERIARELHAAGKGKEDLDKLEVPEPYKDWWLERFFPQNVGFLLERMKG